MPKRKSNELEYDSNPECIASLNPHKKIKYNKNNIEKILYGSTNKNIEVFLSYSNKQKQGTTRNSATYELIARIQLYLSEKKEDVQHYLVLYLNTEELVDIAYLGHLYYSDMYQNWKLDIIPLVNYKKIKQIELDIECNLDAIDVGIPGAKIYNDLNIIGKHVEQVIEYAKLRIGYLKLNKSNFQQYKLEFDSIELSESSISEAHRKILEQSSNDNNK